MTLNEKNRKKTTFTLKYVKMRYVKTVHKFRNEWEVIWGSIS